jgi:hypothetical protein
MTFNLNFSELISEEREKEFKNGDLLFKIA